MGESFSRRGFLKASAFVGCSAAAFPLVTPVALASGPWDARLVVIILRGGMDGVDVVRPLGDPAFERLRAGIVNKTEALPLDGYFGLHPGLAGLHPLWAAGELAFVHAVSTPYRDKRSHFDGQDILEAGTGTDVAADQMRSGWLNRMLQAMPGLTSETAFAVGREDLLLTHGTAPVRRWAPEAELALSAQARLLLAELYREDELFRVAADEALDLSETLDRETVGRVSETEALAAFAAERLREETRIAAFSISGWDTHRNQTHVLGRSLSRLEEAILTLKGRLGPVWEKTTVIAMTEFGRTARQNGTGGTDHGTGGAMVMAGGAVRGGKVYGQWPGLDEAALYDRRDLMPTADVRAYAGWALREMFGLDRAVVEGTVFPGLELGENPGVLL